MSLSELTPKQEKFCQLYIELGNASEAYRQSYDCSRMSNEAVNVEAVKLLNSQKNPKIALRVEELKQTHQERHNLTIDDLLDELETARKGALSKKQFNIAVQATMGKAKLLGFDRKTLELQGENIPATRIELDLDFYKEARRQMLELDDC
ncbi:MULTISPECIES: terminase small subunit [Pasteurellaceae]|uniref:terminase small subunit n=1 Tax=Pasteurellaceae TaxID=712 RepID=UPI0035679653